MRCDYAPMEGITNYLCRNAHHRYFGGVDRYFMPFVSPCKDHVFTKRELRDIIPEHNEGVPVVPQLLTRVPEDFLWAAKELKAMGYREVNLNLGCPSGTVVAKGKGSGLLASAEELDRFLDAIFSGTDLILSVKTRLGLRQEEEFGPLLEVYNRYPIACLTIHPRVQKDFYRGAVRMEAFRAALAMSRNPVCYNGDLVTAEKCQRLEAAFPGLDGVMLGRGLVGDPALGRKLRGGEATDKETLRAFHDTLYAGYCEAFGSAHSAMSRMKEMWFYLIGLFADSGRQAKALRKADTPQKYERQVAEIFRDLPLRQDNLGLWRDVPAGPLGK